jgi:hypothetical protein
VRGSQGQVSKDEASAVQYGFVALKVFHGQDGEAGYLVDVGLDGGCVGVSVCKVEYARVS